MFPSTIGHAAAQRVRAAQRFGAILLSIGLIQVANIEPAMLKKGFRKAMIKFHPDKAQQKGASWDTVVLNEEIMKFIQNECKYTSKH